MAKELTHRAEELKELGWGQEDLYRYIELWDYRQRWGAINLEREDRQFLRKAESLLPAITKTKPSSKKPLKEKSYYRWLSFHLEQMNSHEQDFKIKNLGRGLWPIILEEEIRTLDYYEPVLGLPDTIKAKSINKIREDLIGKALSKFSKNVEVKTFDFQETLAKAKSNGKMNASWRSLREVLKEEDKTYPLLDQDFLNEFRQMVRTNLEPLIRETFPSLTETDKPPIPDEWNP